MRQRGSACGRRRLLPAVLALLAVPALAAGPGRAAPAPEPRGRIALVADAVERGHFSYARKLAEEAPGLPLEAYVRWRELLEAPEPPAFEAYAGFLARYPDWPDAAVVRARGEDRIDEGVGLSDRLAYFARAEPRTRQGRIRFAEALLGAGQRARAIGYLRRAWVEDDFGADQERLFLASFGGALRPDEHRARLDRLLWDGQIAAAQRLLPRVEPRLRKLATARIRLQGLERSAETAYADVPKELRGDPGLQYDRLRFFTRRSRDAQAAELLSRPPASLGRPELWWREQHRLIRDLIDDGEPARAYALARAHRQTKGVPFAEAEFLAGWLALRFQRDARAAQAHFQRLWQGVGAPISRGRAAYWAGRASAARGDEPTAAAWYRRATAYPSTFYGQEAARELGLPPLGDLAEAPRPAAAARDALLARPVARLAAALCGERDRALAQPFFRHLGATAREPGAVRAVAALAERCGRADLALAAARAFTRETDEVDLYASYPVPKVRALLASGASLPLPSLRLAVARQESLFDAGARSPAGALGLMQLMPATAQATARTLELPYARTRLVSDPEYNARLGSVYLGQQLERYRGEPVLAAAAYNAGPGRVAAWLEAFGDPRGAERARLIDWIELIPFNETRNYVQRVLEAEAVYARLLRPTPEREAAASSDDRRAPRS